MNDGHRNGRRSTGPVLEVLPDVVQVDRTGAQGTWYRSTPFGQVEALQVGMQPSTTSREGTVRVDDRSGHVPDHHPDHPQQGRPLVLDPATHAGPHRAHEGIRGALGAAGGLFREPDPWSSTWKSSAPAHGRGPEASSSASSGRMSIFQPVSFAARRAF
jgi:hypothetical protein